ncbi:MAG: 1,4-dihydroxy-6-naphthoate synthase [Thermodesulfobacteriota bacterium]
MSSHPVSLAFSPCPNDTFIFHGLAHGLLPPGSPAFTPPVLADVETLNTWALAGRFDVTKLSCHALGLVLDQYVLLEAGAALGRGCGPLVVARERLERAGLARLTVAIPGRLTTAALLFGLWAPEAKRLVAMPFSEIMPAVAAGRVDAGVIIHEGRFTFPDYGLQAVADLGAWWEEESGQPIPLGGIAARRSLGAPLIAAIDAAVRASVRLAQDTPGATSAYVRAHAQELAAPVIAQHIALYVNDFSLNLGATGRAAVRHFLARGRAVGLLPDQPGASGQPLFVSELRPDGEPACPAGHNPG